VRGAVGNISVEPTEEAARRVSPAQRRGAGGEEKVHPAYGVDNACLIARSTVLPARISVGGNCGPSGPTRRLNHVC